MGGRITFAAIWTLGFFGLGLVCGRGEKASVAAPVSSASASSSAPAVPPWACPAIADELVQAKRLLETSQAPDLYQKLFRDCEKAKDEAEICCAMSNGIGEESK